MLSDGARSLDIAGLWFVRFDRERGPAQVFEESDRLGELPRDQDARGPSTGARSPRRRNRSCSTSRSSPGSRSKRTSASSARPAPARAISRSRSAASAAIASPSRPRQEWVSRLEPAQDRNQLEAELRRLERYHLLVVDEVGYLPLERQAANLLFALVSRRYERGSIIVTSNRGFEQWGEIPGDAMVAAYWSACRKIGPDLRGFCRAL